MKVTVNVSCINLENLRQVGASLSLSPKFLNPFCVADHKTQLSNCFVFIHPFRNSKIKKNVR